MILVMGTILRRMSSEAILRSTTAFRTSIDYISYHQLIVIVLQMSSSLPITDFDHIPKPEPHASIEGYLTYFRMGFNQAMLVKLSMRAYTNLCSAVVNYLTCCAPLSDLDETMKGKSDLPRVRASRWSYCFLQEDFYMTKLKASLWSI